MAGALAHRSGVPLTPRLWSERLVAVLYLLTSLVLAVLYLAPAALLLVSANGVSIVMQALLGNPDAREVLPQSIAASVLLVPSATLLARLSCRIQRRRLESVFGIVETTVTDTRRTEGPVPRALRHLFGLDAWSAVLYSTVAGLTGLLSGGLAALLVTYGIGATLGGVLGIALVLADGTFAEAFDDGDHLGVVFAFILLGPLAALVGLRIAPCWSAWTPTSSNVCCSTPRRCGSAVGSSNCATAAHAWWTPPRPSAAGSNAICTTAPSSESSPSR